MVFRHLRRLLTSAGTGQTPLSPTGITTIAIEGVTIALGRLPAIGRWASYAAWAFCFFRADLAVLVEQNMTGALLCLNGSIALKDRPWLLMVIPRPSLAEREASSLDWLN
jgi:hypothetical protein